jgi:restriction system protein
MAEVTRKRLGQLVRAVFEILLDKPEGMQIKEIIPALEAKVGLTDFERSDYPKFPGIRRFDKIIRFATIAPVKAGWLVKSRGLWTLTAEGKSAYAKYKDPEEFTEQVRRLYRQWVTDRQPSMADIEDSEYEEAAVTNAFEEAEENAWAEIQEYLAKLAPYDFQELIAGLLKAMGYHIAWVAPPGPDGGTDIVAFSDPLGTQGPRIKVQVKRRADKVDVEGLRSFLAVLGEQDIGIFVNVGGFTSKASEEARAQVSRRVTLIDLKRLFDLWVEHYQKVEAFERQLLPLKPVYYLAPET